MIIVFDIDETLCCTYQKALVLPEHYKHKYIINHHHELYDGSKEIISHYFLPPSLIGNLIRDFADIRIVFFSAGPGARNEYVLKEWLQEYPELQYDIFSRPDLTVRRISDNGKKDLRKVLKEGEKLEDVIFIDDKIDFWIEGQGRFIHALPFYMSIPSGEENPQRPGEIELAHIETELTKLLSTKNAHFDGDSNGSENYRHNRGYGSF